jgi:hypothetical protein
LPILHQFCIKCFKFNNKSTATYLLLEAVLSFLPLDPSSAPGLGWLLKFNTPKRTKINNLMNNAHKVIWVVYKNIASCKLWGSHGRDYENYHVLEYDSDICWKFTNISLEHNFGAQPTQIIVLKYHDIHEFIYIWDINHCPVRERRKKGFQLYSEADHVLVWINYSDKGNLRIAYNNHETPFINKQVKCSIENDWTTDKLKCSVFKKSELFLNRKHRLTTHLLSRKRIIMWPALPQTLGDFDS